ncbi:MAG TPA: NADH:ubiquinone reductase (Na(+)-transporting) subunit F [Tenuifilaceae bacterium]|jgi:Na+-transporting NADH:ubiquinone oxidoreductase subunit F|nr:NADH:ubiquinone reductase (Na(+)-transporting) subunit F [Bacteroidales bacterium]MDI9516653.1 NADH:ubiquinone reductase (Na(+)-transporting) subunit F [Bacteroidota bacterium]NLH55731.1 NADH:ubiquinone reductase (Na(+)-transporting) subunit F [Rikenellaceae bacterium]OQC63887.1 MAG: Na(+)-translocating NADH-quinone reductase subunit F [Bacteroidetes bacterium ADurb.Bin008]HNV80690.1 NADH:ubiquinone reductase (Na(+)-transporting) subunit F [Tenuifilaceae bacterium]
MILLSSSGSVLFSAIVVFLIVMLFLVGILLYAKKKLTPSGSVKLDINDGKRVLEVEPGGTVLNTLSNNKIFLPSACGGGGTCGMCKCRVLEGGGSILTTEVNFFTRKQQNENWRLGCQVKVREDLKIEIPEEVMGIKKWECEVISNRNVATFIKEFVVKLPEGEKLDFKSGGYIQIDVPKLEVDFGKDIFVEEEFRDEWDKFKMWDLKMKNPEETYRAYSMANHPAENNIIMLNIRIATPPWDRTKNAFLNVNPGVCSSFIFSRKPGDKVYISGPYGEFFIKDTQNEMLFIGGGAGMAPMRSHIFHLFNTVKTGRKVSFWYGARSRREIFYEDHFRAIEKKFPNFNFHIALSEPKSEDNWDGYKGFIHQVILDNYLSKHDAPEDIEYYLCGPPMMNEAVFKMLYDLGVPNEMVAYDDFG